MRPHAGLSDPLLNSAPCGYFSFGDDGIVRAVNDTLLGMLGRSREQLVGQHVERFLTKGTRIFYHTHWFPLLRMHGEAEEVFLMLLGEAGEEVGVLSNARRREQEDGAVFDCIVMRVRERQKYEGELLRAKRAAELAVAEAEERAGELRAVNELLESQAYELEVQQQQLEEASQAKSAFLAVMSHELRTPLNAISGYAELIELGIQGPVTDAQRESLDRIRRSQRHLLRLINDILNLSRIEAGRVDYRIEPFDMAEVVAEIAPMIEPQMAQKRIAFDSAVPAGLRVCGDREKVQQILLNVLGNAAKFTPEGGAVRIHAPEREGAENQAFIAVTDNGIGLAADQLEHIFEPFVQVDTSRSGHREGTGLGLAISRDLARGMGGDLRARSEPGSGSTFTLVLPRE